MNNVPIGTLRCVRDGQRIRYIYHGRRRIDAEPHCIGEPVAGGGYGEHDCRCDGSAGFAGYIQRAGTSNFDARQSVEIPIAGISRVLGTSGIYNLAFTGAGVASSGGVGQEPVPASPASVRKTIRFG